MVRRVQVLGRECSGLHVVALRTLFPEGLTQVLGRECSGLHVAAPEDSVPRRFAQDRSTTRRVPSSGCQPVKGPNAAFNGHARPYILTFSAAHTLVSDPALFWQGGVGPLNARVPFRIIRVLRDSVAKIEELRLPPEEGQDRVGAPSSSSAAWWALPLAPEDVHKGG